MSKAVTQDEVAKHNSEKNGVWIVIDNNVYDMSSLYVPYLLCPLNHMLMLFLRTVSTNILEERRSSFVLLEKMPQNKYSPPPSLRLT